MSIALVISWSILIKTVGRVESRARLLINRLIFSPYSHEQVKEILEERLSALSLSAFDSKAREFVARKASSTAGDLRAALKICQTTIEMYRDFIMQQEQDKKSNKSGTNNSVPSTTTSNLSKIFALVNAAVNRYKETPFISVVSRMSQLEKAIILCFCKHRKLICGGDDHSALAGMTMLMAWDRFVDLIRKIGTDDFYNTNNATVSSTTASATAAAGPNKTISSTNSAKITLKCPPIQVFQQCLAKLEGTGVLNTTTSYRPCGRPVIHYHVSSSFLYSDFVAAVNNDPLSRFVAIA